MDALGMRILTNGVKVLTYTYALDLLFLALPFVPFSKFTSVFILPRLLSLIFNDSPFRH
jgi:hypothetical protein